MAGTTSNTPITLDGLSGASLTLPHGTQMADMALHRDGQDLVLRGDGQDIVVEGYFLSDPQPDLMSESGARLSPDLVQSFIVQEGPAQYAAFETMSDVSPVGHITELEGTATIIRSDGSSHSIQNGMPVFEGDIIETADNGAVNITFIDESSFAVSDNARMAIDEFVFDPSDESGATDISVLKGVFLFTSGLIGRENPDAVEIETPVGSIGIRGTIIGGDIKPSGEESQISVIEGAIVVRNGAGESILSDQFATVKISDFNSHIQDIGVLGPQAMAVDYGAVKGVSPSLFSSINDIIRENAQTVGKEAVAKEAAAQATEEPQDSNDSDTIKPADQPEAEQAKPLQEAIQEDTTKLDNKDFKELKLRILDERGNDESSEAADKGAARDIQALQAELKTAEDVQNFTKQTATSLEFKGDSDVDEGAAAGTKIGQVGPTQALPFAVRYSLIDDAGGSFVINPVTGEIFLTAAGSGALDFENAQTQNIIVRATNTRNGATRDTTLNIDINDVNEAPTLSLDNTGVNVDEHAVLTLTSTMVNGNDQDGGALTYNVSHLTNGVVQVSGVPAASFTQAQLDNGDVTFVHDGSETLAASFKIMATDGALTTAQQTLGFTVNPIDDAISAITFDGNPVEAADAIMNINVEGQDIGRFAVSDAEQMSGFTYTILDGSGTVDNRFIVTEAGGFGHLSLKPGVQLTALGALDLTVRVTDNGGNSKDLDLELDVRADAITLTNAGNAALVGDALTPPANIDIGDFNRDGFADHFSLDTTVTNGQVDITLGRGLSNIVSSGTAAFAFDGAAANIGDINTGGRDDLAIGASGYNSGHGAVKLMTSNSSVVLTSHVAGAHFGASIAALGDTNADGFADFMVTAPGEDAAYLVYGHASALNHSATLNAVSRTRIHDGGDPDSSITSIAGAGDFNGDGFSDFIVTLTDSDAGQTANIIYVVYGSDSLGSSINLHDLTDDANKAYKIFLNPSDTGNSSNISVDGIGDVDGDGFDDISITAHDADADGQRFVVEGGNYTGDADLINTGTLTAAADHGDSLIGNHANNLISDNEKNDVTLKGGRGDDVTIINNDNFRLLDGGQGHDLLRINSDSFSIGPGSETVDLRAKSGAFHNFETIEMNGNYDELKIYMSDVLTLLSQSSNDRLIIDSTGTDNEIKFFDLQSTGTQLTDEGFSDNGQVTYNGETYDSFVQAGTGYEVLLDSALIGADNGGTV